MSRTFVSIAVALSASGLWLVDSAIKGAALLFIAGLITLSMRRDSAATRHWIWLVAIAAMLVVPVMSALLPQWRVLPAWVMMPDAIISRTVTHGVVPPESRPNASTQEDSFMPAPQSHEFNAQAILPAQSSIDPSAGVKGKQPELTAVSVERREPQSSLGALQAYWLSVIPWCWAIGSGFLFLRLLAARLLLGRTQSESIVIDPHCPCESDSGLLKSLKDACSQLQIYRRITLLIHPEKNIPIVWGIWRNRLLLPEASRQWSEEQLRSVLLHELAHIKRRDALSQLLAQTACAMHWFNPLVWFAAWRLHVERERACDDLVLASGVRASAYAEHLLNVATQLTSSRWTRACGLAMARSSSLQSRLTAVLNARQNRRGVTSALLALSVVVSAAIAVPLAMMSTADEVVSATPRRASEAQGSVHVEQAAETKVAVTSQSTTGPVNSAGINSLPEGLEEHLDWSEPVGGLRAAVMIRSVEAPGILGQERRIFLVVQNVSDQAVRLCDTAIHETDVPAADVEGRKLYLKRRGEILFALQNAKSTKTDVVLQQREVLWIDLFDNEKPREKGPKVGDSMSEGIVKDPYQSLFAVLNIVHAPEGAWTGKLKTPTTRGAFTADGKMPKSTEGQVLFRYCIDHARLGGDIPGGLISRLHDLVQEFIRNNADDEFGAPYAKKMQPLLIRFEHKGDWKQSDAVALFDDIAIVTTIPLERTMEIIRENTLQRGQQLASSLKDVHWGEALPGGLRMAWILEPRENKYHLGSSLKSRVVLHNSGNEPVIFVTRSFQQPPHTVMTASGAAVKMESTSWTTRGRPEPYRLHPGESCEVHAPGVGIGARNKDLEDWSNVRVGTSILANEGDEIVFKPGAVMLTGDHNETSDPDWWVKFITERIDRDAPLPADAKEREVVLFRVIADLFGGSPTPDEAAAFLTDKSPVAVSNLAKLLSTRTWHKSVTGSIKSGNTQFRVLPEDPEAATKPRVAMNPGFYNLEVQLRLNVTRRPEGDRIVNEASLVWFQAGKENVSTNVPLPDNYDSWVAGWAPNSTILWVSQKGLLDSYDFTDNAIIKRARFEGDQIANAPIPTDVREALRVALEKAVPQQKLKPPPPAAVAPAPAKP